MTIPDIGSRVWRKEPVHAGGARDGQPVVEAFVIEVGHTDGGEVLLTLAQWWDSYAMRLDSSRKAEWVPKVRLSAARIEDLICDDPSPAYRQSARAAGLIALALGVEHRNGAKWNYDELTLWAAVERLVMASGPIPAPGATPIPKPIPSDLPVGGRPKWAESL